MDADTKLLMIRFTGISIILFDILNLIIAFSFIQIEVNNIYIVNYLSLKYSFINT